MAKEAGNAPDVLDVVDNVLARLGGSRLCIAGAIESCPYSSL